MADQNNFSILGRAKTLPDVQRSWMWNLVIPGIRTMAPQSALGNEEDLIIRCRSMSTGSRTTNSTTSEFMGTKQAFPGKVDTLGIVTATFEETEDQRITKILYEWQQLIFNMNPENPIAAGKSKFPYKRLMSKDIFLIMYKYDGTPLEKMIRFMNCWPQNVPEISLDYSSGNSVIVSCSFQYDNWTLFPDTTI
jgi:hypothetical protein